VVVRVLSFGYSGYFGYLHGLPPQSPHLSWRLTESYINCYHLGGLTVGVVIGSSLDGSTTP